MYNIVQCLLKLWIKYNKLVCLCNKFDKTIFFFIFGSYLVQKVANMQTCTALKKLHLVFFFKGAQKLQVLTNLKTSRQVFSKTLDVMFSDF